MFSFPIFSPRSFVLSICSRKNRAFVWSWVKSKNISWTILSYRLSSQFESNEIRDPQQHNTTMCRPGLSAPSSIAISCIHNQNRVLHIHLYILYPPTPRLQRGRPQPRGSPQLRGYPLPDAGPYPETPRGLLIQAAPYPEAAFNPKFTPSQRPRGCPDS